jgi:four helix bundle protein
MRDIRERAFDFACRIVRLHGVLVRRWTTRQFARQLVRAGTSVGANLEEAEAAQSKADFISKNRIALKEARETYYWLRILATTELVAPVRVEPLIVEANEIVAVLTAIVKSASTPPK